jgi:hypothetical protein
MRSDDSYIVWSHEEIAHNPQSWYYCAETLFGSAEYLFDGLRKSGAAARLAKKQYMDSHYASYGLLVGYALECILKGLWVKEGHILVRDGKVIRIPGVGDHDLLPLAHKVGVPLKRHEADVVNRLSYFVRAVGRYPIPMSAHEILPRRVRGRGAQNPEKLTADEWQIARETTNRLLDELRDTMY